MGFWWFMFAFNMMFSLVMILGGRCLRRVAGKEINGLIGYRTGLSMKNRDTWHFANEDCGRRWWKIGWILLLPTIAVQLPFYGSDTDTVGRVGLVICIVECTVMLLSILPTAIALRKTFNRDGTRKT